MRICIINEFFYPDTTGGTGTVLSSLVRHLRTQHPEVSIDVITTRSVYRGEEVRLPPHEDWEGVQIRRIGVPRPRGAGMMSRLSAGLMFSVAAGLRLALRQRYDCVLVTTAPPTLPMAARAWGRGGRSPFVYVIYDLFPDVPVALGTIAAQGRVARICRRFQGKWLRSACKVVVLGRCMRDHMEANYGLSRDKMEVIPIWSDQAEAPSDTQTQFRGEHGLSGPVILYAGNFGQCQDFDTLLDAARQMQERCASGTWVFVGEGDKKEHIARRIEQEGLSNVRLFPFVPREEFADLLASADISLVTLEPGAEGLGVPSKFYNILASGRATVAVVSAGSEVARVLEEEECGVVVAHGDVSHLAATISSLASDTPRRHKMGQAARCAFENNYTVEHASQKFHSLLMQVVSPAANHRQDQEATNQSAQVLPASPSPCSSGVAGTASIDEMDLAPLARAHRLSDAQAGHMHSRRPGQAAVPPAKEHAEVA